MVISIYSQNLVHVTSQLFLPILEVEVIFCNPIPSVLSCLIPPLGHAILSINIYTSLSSRKSSKKLKKAEKWKKANLVTQANSWNSTNEQIALLEATYNQGIRIPSRDQIDQIASRLRVYGNIEGKNVFYWFQNRKPREKQRQKQERMASINPFQEPSLARKSRKNNHKSAVIMAEIHVNSTTNKTINADNLCEPPTLELFALHPTGKARANPHSVMKWRNDCRSDEYIDEQNDPGSGGGHFHNFFHFIPGHPGK